VLSKIVILIRFEPFWSIMLKPITFGLLQNRMLPRRPQSHVRRHRKATGTESNCFVYHNLLETSHRVTLHTSARICNPFIVRVVLCKFDIFQHAVWQASFCTGEPCQQLQWSDARKRCLRLDPPISSNPKFDEDCFPRNALRINYPKSSSPMLMCKQSVWASSLNIMLTNRSW